MPRQIAAFVVTALAFLGMDAVWISQTGDRLYRPALGPILLDGVRPVAAVLFYGVYLTGVFVFAVRRGIEAGRALSATRSGALFGFVAYATYDLTNQATLKVWSTEVTVLDLAWGTFATAVAASAGAAVGLMGRKPAA
jgi:uncharacterized membrane protein